MAFNFNWSPLTADADFYQRATGLLTAALNKSPKPPIIVDDIIVTELNLGSQAPDLDILEIGDIADDRFRGIFKMSYKGDAFLTLRTKVQANPLNTYLSSKPSFTSPSPLAAQSGLTIPLSITLSDFKLSGFVILVFSKQKGLTIVFRNDPLESLKVSSTFDSISFVREYLQKTIEAQLRNLFMEELPAIIHRLSLRLWCPDQLPKEGEEGAVEGEEKEAAVDPLASPPVDPVDAHGNLLDSNDIANLSLNGGSEMPSLFSQKNLLRLSALRDSQETLSLFTPGIRTALWRAAAGWDRPNPENTPPLLTPSVTKTYSFSHGQTHSVTSYTFSDTGSTANGQLPSRPSLSSFNSSAMALGAGSTARTRSYMGGKKHKRRVVRTPLRRSKTENAAASEASSEAGEITDDTGSVQGPTSEPFATSITEESEEEPAMPQAMFDSAKSDKTIPSRPPLNRELFTPPQPEVPGPNTAPEKVPLLSTRQSKSWRKAEKSPMVSMHPGSYPENNNVILEQAWISKMASEIARRVYDEKARNGDFWAEQTDVPPPAYEAQ
ncbi:mitochondrial distribution and morphology protein 34 [Zalerion maritima]|uniref:Mitochondrial distribution and morphology protein 34 n=1 Tax=Zalerion maritima TaxID=339359 RepID=A0AAD5WSP2_9PEZI|nr:mitochondrial distribution and morphology protein 34 [Zalerion maritima]